MRHYWRALLLILLAALVIPGTAQADAGSDWYTHPVWSPDDLPARYAQVLYPGAPVYLSREDALAKAALHRRSPGTLTVVAYSTVEQVNETLIYGLSDGGWMRGEDLRPAVVPAFSGVLPDPSGPVDFSFGWVMKAGFSAADTPRERGSFYGRRAVVRVLAVEGAGADAWAEVAPGAWLPLSSIARVTPAAAPPDGVSGCRWIAVDLSQQTLSVYQDCRLVFATLISSGREAGWTWPGVYAVQRKVDLRTLTSATLQGLDQDFYFEDVPWLLYYDGLWALHTAYWHDRFGTPWSHGCINLSPADAHWLYAWAQIGDPVVINR